MVRWVSKPQEETEMARRGENIHKRKDGRWEGRYIKARTPEGKIQWGYVYGTVYAEVKRVLIQKKAEAGFYNLKRTDLTFETLAEVWLHSQRNAVKESTYAHYSYTLHKYLLPVLSKVPVASLDESFLEQAMQQIIAPTDATHKPLGNSSARECLSMLRRICKYAAHLRLIRPMELEVALPKAVDKISVPLSPAEQQRLYQYVQENPTPRKIGLLLGLELGLRIGEMLMKGRVNTSYVFYVHPDEIEAITREFAAIGNNLNQIAAFFNSGGIQSRAMHENINHAIACIFEMREKVAEMAGKNYGNLKAHRK